MSRLSRWNLVYGAAKAPTPGAGEALIVALTDGTATVLHRRQTAVTGMRVSRFDLSVTAVEARLLEGLEGARIAAVVMPAGMEARITDGRRSERKIGNLGTKLTAHLTTSATSSIGEAGVVYTADCSALLAQYLIDACEKSDCRLISITTADYAWAEGAKDVLGRADACVVAVQLEDATQVRLIVAHTGAPVFLRRLPLNAELESLSLAIESMVGKIPSDGICPPVVALGDAEFRGRIADATKAALGTALVEPRRWEDLDYDPATVAAAFAGTGPRFVPPEVVRGAKARTRRRGLLAAAAAVICIGLAGFLDILDLRSEIDRVRAARQDVAAKVQSAMTERDHVTDLTRTLARLEARRLTTPRWTAMLGAVADATPRDAHVRALRAVDDSIYVELEGEDVLTAVESLRQIPWWRSLRTASSVATEVEDEGAITERVTVAAVVEWDPLNEAEARSP